MRWGWRRSRPAAGQRVEARVAESDHDPAEFLFEVLAGRVEEVDELDEFGRAEAVDVDVRVAFFDAVEQVDVPVEREFWVHAACMRTCVPPTAVSSSIFS